MTINEFMIILYLAMNIVHEAPNDPVKAQEAIAHVLLNRSNVCNQTSIVNTPDHISNELRRNKQFSWTNKKSDGERDAFYVLDLLEPVSFDLFSQAMYAASNAFEEHRKREDPTGGALYYHARKLKPLPKWTLQKTAIPYNFKGGHIFYLGNNGKFDSEFCEKSLVSLNPIKRKECKNTPPLKCPECKQESEPRPDPRIEWIKTQLYLISQQYR